MNVAEIVTQKIISALEKGVPPWVKTWSGNPPTNLVSKKEYQGINLLLLERGGYYLTFQQLTEMGGQLKKGANSELVVFYKKYTPKKKTDDEQNDERRVLRYYKVFHVEDIEGIEFTPKAGLNLNPNEVIDKAETASRNYITAKQVDFKIVLGSDSAFYAPARDSITMPHISQFATSENYYLTLFHEIVHSTGATNRLNRELKGYHQSRKSYSLEELTAEIGSCFIAERINMDISHCFTNSVAYIKGWSNYLKSDPRAILKASALAAKAMDYVLE